MKMRWMIFVLMLTVSLAFAQTPAGTKTNTKQSAPFSKKTAKTTKAAAPKTMAPKGLTRKPAAYAAKAERSAAVALPGGKKSAAKKGASVAYR